MRFDWTTAFAGDWHQLPDGHRALFRAVVSAEFHPACERLRADPTSPFPKKLRVKPVTGAPGIWEMTWSFAGPDGRATFEWIEIAGEPTVRWRRIGDHAIFGSP